MATGDATGTDNRIVRLNEFVKAIQEPDRLLDVTLRAQMFIDEAINRILALCVQDETHLPGGLDIERKVDLIQAIRPGGNESVALWNAVKKLNKVRGAIAHAREPEEHSQYHNHIRNLRAASAALSSDPKITGQIPEFSDHDLVVITAAMVLAYLGKLEHVDRFDDWFPVFWPNCESNVLGAT